MHVRKASSLLAGLTFCLVLIAPTSWAQSSRRGVLVVGGTQGLSETYAVKGRSVSVSGNNHRITLRGRCPSLRVSGTDNRVYADAVRSVSLSGRNNRVYWRRLYNGRKPRVSDAGSGNRVLRRSPGR